MSAEPGFQAEWRERLASGSRLVAKAFAQTLREDAGRLPAAAALAGDPSPHVRVAALRALAEVSDTDGRLVAPYAKEVVEGLAAPEPDAQAAALTALANLAPHAPAEMALALPLVADLLDRARRPALREEAARALGRMGHGAPDRAAQAAEALARALGRKAGKLAPETREILAALEALLPHLPPTEKGALAGRIAPLRGHPNIQVRERAGRLARALAA